MKTRDADQCLELSFRPMIAGTGFGSSEQEQVFRFSGVVLTATFDPSCWRGGCTDRQTVLENAQVVSVSSRRSSSIGLWLGDASPITELTGPVAEDMKVAANAAGLSPGPDLKAFQTQGENNKRLICWTALDGEPGSWPNSYEGALYAKSTRDFYSCRTVRKVGDRMVVQAVN